MMAMQPVDDVQQGGETEFPVGLRFRPDDDDDYVEIIDLRLQADFTIPECLIHELPADQHTSLPTVQPLMNDDDVFLSCLEFLEKGGISEEEEGVVVVEERSVKRRQKIEGEEDAHKISMNQQQQPRLQSWTNGGELIPPVVAPSPPINTGVAVAADDDFADICAYFNNDPVNLELCLDDCYIRACDDEEEKRCAKRQRIEQGEDQTTCAADTAVDSNNNDDDDQRFVMTIDEINKVVDENPLDENLYSDLLDLLRFYMEEENPLAAPPEEETSVKKD